MQKPKSVELYILSVPSSVRGKLKELRAAIKQAAPKAMEKISYGMPYYDYKGRLAYFRLAKGHIGLYIPGSILLCYKKELKDYSTTKATLRLPLNEKLPIPLIKKLIKERMGQIDKK